MSGEPDRRGGGRSVRTLVIVGLAGALLAAFFAGLGLWQVERLAWKLALIERVEARVAADPIPAPGPADWRSITADSAEYRNVAVTGRFEHERETLVQAVTDLGPGFWVMTPLVTDAGWSVLVNRGFVDADHRDPAARAAGRIEGETIVTGLLRIAEPDGGFLRANDPEAGRWFSRDVAAIAAQTGTREAAPYFVDADATPMPGGWPRGGLTVIAFRNHHLVYALTWFALAAMVAAATIFVFVDDRRRRRTVPRLGEARS